MAKKKKRKKNQKRPKRLEGKGLKKLLDLGKNLEK